MMMSGINEREGPLWCILWTAGPKTLALVEALSAAGYVVWTPTRTIRRPKPGQRRQLVMGTKRQLVEVSVPILSGLVLASFHQRDDLLRLSELREGTNCPRFRVFQFAGKTPAVPERSISGLRAAQEAADAEIQALRDADTREAEREARALLMRTESQRRRALRSERKTFDKGDKVIIGDAPSFAGMIGTVVESSTGSTVRVQFGGFHAVTVGAWQTFPTVLGEQQSYMDAAA